MRIFIIGYMGSGKTTLGKQLATKLGYKFVDLDDVIEQQYGITISEIFAQFGETHFRKSESCILQETETDDDIVISTGGGAPCFYNNMDIINSLGESIYLKIRPEVLVSRLANGKSKRPLIKDKTDEELLAFVSAKVTEREPFYTQAKHILQGDNLQVSDLQNAVGL